MFSTSNVLACENPTIKASTEKTTDTTLDNNCNKSCIDKENKHDKDCGESCCNSSCHCPNIVNVFGFHNICELSNMNNFKTLNVTWAYVQHLYKDTYLAIWQPPKIS